MSMISSEDSKAHKMKEAQAPESPSPSTGKPIFLLT